MELQKFYIETLKISDVRLVQILADNTKVKLIKKGEILRRVPQERLVDELMAEIDKM